MFQKDATVAIAAGCIRGTAVSSAGCVWEHGDRDRDERGWHHDHDRGWHNDYDDYDHR